MGFDVGVESGNGQEAKKFLTSRPVSLIPDSGNIQNVLVIQYQSSSRSSALSGTLPKILHTKKVTSKISHEQLKQIAGRQSSSSSQLVLILLSIRKKANYIHIQSSDAHVRMHFRMESILHDCLKLDQRLLLSSVSCLEVFADLDITDNRRPQIGRFSALLSNRTIKIFVASIR